MQRKINFAPGEFYHIYNRGNNKSLIFLDESDKKRFQKLLHVCNGRNPVVFKTIQSLALDKIKKGDSLVDIGVYCLMDNHFHLLLREKEEGGISAFVQKLLTAYSKYFNKKYERTGVLFEGPFRAKHADTDEYLKYLFAYIHLNPVKMIDAEWKENGIQDRTAAKEFLGKYPYSSYLDYMGSQRREVVLIERSTFPEYFSSNVEFDYFINDWLSMKEDY